MEDVLNVMLARYQCHSRNDYENALKEIIQEIALLGLWRAKFFEKAAFYGGTALRILYGLDRFSEDLDFSLLKTDTRFQLTQYLSAVEAELSSFGFKVSVEEKVKSKHSAIQSAFIKAETKEHLLMIQIPKTIHSAVSLRDLIKVKIEVDVNPPGGFKTEAKPLFQPIPFMVNTYQLPDLFAGKLHAILCRQWKNRVKGRDWYDLVWYVSRDTPVRLKHLQKRLEQTDAWTKRKAMTLSDLIELLQSRIDNIDFNVAKKEVLPFIKNSDHVEVWSKKFFKELISKIRAV